ncbi:nucleophosmin 1b isoform X1 [Ictalurus punctatus]|uniref:Nucleophosmin n=1 Tax=Ictalurus punctatus TaxID=7998 RepID=A0A2D0RIV7_ICTPU|nr:nucleophosmin 1b isoform X1 [Ictalurus punctatus]
MAENLKDLSRPQMFLFGCVLKADKKEHKVEVDDDEVDHQLSLKAVCLGAEAEDKLHTVEIEGVTYDGKTTKIPLAVLKPSILPSLSLGGFEITPPFTFRLQSGAGPVYISGQHFVSGLGMKESDDEEEEEENNTSPVKRPSNMATGKVPLKKLKMDSDDDDDDDDEDEDDDSEDEEDDDSDEHDEDEKPVAPSPIKPSLKAPEKKKSADKQNGSPGKKDDKPGKPQSQVTIKGKDKTGAGPSGKTPSKLSISEVKNRLAAAAKEGKPFPKTDQKFENYAKHTFKISDKQVIKDLWNFVQTLKK